MSKIYIFDLDGTLVNSMKGFEKATLSVLREDGISYPDDLIKILTPLGCTKTAEYYSTVFGVKGTPKEIAERIKSALLDEYSQNIKLKPNVEKYLRKLNSEGARLFVLTANLREVTQTTLKANGVSELFEKLWSVDELGHSKTEPELFMRVAEIIGCRPEDINYFDDHPTAISTATLAGANTYGVSDIQSEAELELIKRTAKHFVSDFSELL